MGDLEARRHGPSEEWTVPVEDPAGRPRAVRIFARDGRVVIVWPPGEGCSTDYAHLMTVALHGAMQAAAEQRRHAQHASRPQGADQRI